MRTTKPKTLLGGDPGLPLRPPMPPEIPVPPSPSDPAPAPVSPPREDDSNAIEEADQP
jgi:hypothetical protein